MGYRILISGASGLIGSSFISSSDCEFIRLVRRSTQASDIVWNFKDDLPKDRLQNLDAVIHLAGENISGGRWSAQTKAKIRESRVRSTESLSRSLSTMSGRPPVFICASAIGFYGDRGDESLTENSSPGQGFLAEVCKDWEQATASATAAGIRVINLRTGIVLSKKGGALEKMLPAFRFCFGGILGSGAQFMSWIHIEDLIQIIHFCLENPNLSGPLNATSPLPVTNAEFTRALAASVHRPMGPRVPEFALKLLFGEMADALFLSSTKVLPKKLMDANFQFIYGDLKTALSNLMNVQS